MENRLGDDDTSSSTDYLEFVRTTFRTDSSRGSMPEEIR
jgi:hypothetical protein